MPISPQEISGFITETYTLAACFLGLGIPGAVGALWYLNRRQQEGEPQTYLVARNPAQTEIIARAQPDGKVEIADTRPTKYGSTGGRLLLSHSDGENLQMPTQPQPTPKW